MTKPKPKARSFVAQDFRVPVDFRDQRPHQRLEHKLGSEGLLAWLTLQARVAVEAPSGRLEGWEGFDVCRAARWDGSDAHLLDALEGAQLIAMVDNAWELVGWAEAQPYIAEAEARSQAATRAISIRWERARASASVPAEVRNDTARIRPVGLENTGGSSVVIPQPNHDQPNHDQPVTPPSPPSGGGPLPADAGHLGGGDVAPAHRMPDKGQQEAQEGASEAPAGRRDVATFPEAFLAFWSSYPQRGRGRCTKTEAFKAWSAAKKLASPEQVQAGLAAWCLSDKWTRDGGEYVESPARWLRNRGWLDAPPPASTSAPKATGPTWAPKPTGFVSEDLKARLLARTQGDGLVVEADVLP